MRLKSVVICIALGGLSLSGQALNLGRVRGAAWIGQPLNMAVSVQIDPGQASDALCPEADVFYADSKLDAYRIQITVEPGPQADAATLRIQSAVPIDEPVVTLYVRAGCNSKSTRRYVLLADYASDVAPATPAGTSATAPSNVPATALNPTPVNNTSVAAAPTATPLPPARTPAVRRTAPVRQERAERKPAAAPAKTPAAGLTPPAATAKAPVPPARSARLQLDPLENLTERIKTLEATTSSAPLKEMVEDSQRIQQLQGDVKALLSQAAKNEATLLALRERLDKAESERMPAAWVIALLALVAAVTAAAMLMWNRRSSSGWQAAAAPAPTPYKSARKSSPDEDADAELQDHWSAPTPQPLRTVRDTPLRERSPSHGETMAMTPADFQNSVSVSIPADVSNSDMMGFDEPRLLHTDLNSPALLDLLQQADFFITLGKANSAIELLEKRIRQNPGDCPMVYLQLLNIANQHNLKTDFRQFRDECMQQFNVEIPEFALFRSEGRSLEEYPELLAHIIKLWPQIKVLDVIESCALMDPQAQVADRFDIAAFRDLILLHGVVRHIAYYRTSAEDVPVKKATDIADAEHISLDL